MPARIETASDGLPVVAIVGRPNVGKSTLFNRVVRARRAIVDDAPGVTRDRVTARAEYEGRAFLCTDTGGFEAESPSDPKAMTARVREQTLRALEGADCIVGLFDGAAGLTPADREMVRLLTKSDKPVLFAVNKIDVPEREGLLYDFYAAGVPTLLPVSAAHNRGMGALLDAVVAALPESTAAGHADAGIRLAFIGRPNVGKSSLLNRLLGEDRVLVSPEAGTTRDAIDTPITVGGVPYVLIDTAGIRRQGRISNPLERHGAVRALGTLTRTDLALIVLDAADGMTDQDARIVGRALEAGRGVVLLANKWDTVPAGSRRPEAFRRELAAKRSAFASLPLVCVSARTGEGLDGLFPVVARVARGYTAALPTPTLNRALKSAVEATRPPSPGGRALRFFYAAQTAQRPPQVTIFTSAPRLVPAAYSRYLTTKLSAAFRLTGVPLRLRFRSRRPDDAPTPARARGSAGPARRSSPSRGGGARDRRR
jgi:GTP-binding protein